MNDTTAPPHTWIDDVQGFALGSVLIALGVVLLKANGQMTGGTAGLAFLLHYSTGLPIGPTFLLANLPFFALAVKQMGWNFTLRSVLAVALLSLLIHLMPMFVTFAHVTPAYSAVGGGVLIGMGALALVRHGASIGGVNILALYMQKRHHISAGTVQGGVDSAILVASCFVIPLQALAWSVLGAVIVGFVLAVNHKPGRYRAL